MLVVDDNRDAAESLREVLRMSGHEVEVVNDGAEALRKLDEFRAEVVLLDIGLPRMDGYMVAHAIRARVSHSAAAATAVGAHRLCARRRPALDAAFRLRWTPGQTGGAGAPAEGDRRRRALADQRSELG